MRRWRARQFLAALLAGCASPPAPQEALAPEPDGACPTVKMRFTRETSCQNDGTVEFCLPKEAEVIARVRALAPELTGPVGGSGRIGCDLTREDLYFFPTREDPGCQPPAPGLSDAGWATLCRIAADPAVQRIGPTWYE